MEENKLPHSIIGAAVAWLVALLAWVAAHAGLFCTVLGMIATIYSIRASRETIKLRKKQQRAVVTPDDSQESE